MARIYYIRDQKNIHTKKNGQPSRGVPVAVICTDLDKDKDQILFAFSVAYKAPKNPHLTCAECGYSDNKNEHEVVYVPAPTIHTLSLAVAVSGIPTATEDPIVRKEFECAACGSKTHAHEKSDHFMKSRGRDMAMARLNKRECFAIKNIPAEGGNKAILTRVMECVANRNEKGKFVFNKNVGGEDANNGGNFPMRIRKLAAAWLDRPKPVKKLPESNLVDAAKQNKTTTAA